LSKYFLNLSIVSYYIITIYLFLEITYKNK